MGLAVEVTKNTQGMKRMCMHVWQGVTASVSQGSVRERGRKKGLGRGGWGSEREAEPGRREESEYVCVGGLKVFMAWVEVSTARTQEAIKQSSKTEPQMGNGGVTEMSPPSQTFLPWGQRVGAAFADCLHQLGTGVSIHLPSPPSTSSRGYQDSWENMFWNITEAGRL